SSSVRSVLKTYVPTDSLVRGKRRLRSASKLRSMPAWLSWRAASTAALISSDLSMERGPVAWCLRETISRSAQDVYTYAIHQVQGLRLPKSIFGKLGRAQRLQECTEQIPAEKPLAPPMCFTRRTGGQACPADAVAPQNQASLFPTSAKIAVNDCA